MSAARLARLLPGLQRSGLDALLVSHVPNVRYLSGFTGSSGLLLVLAGGAAHLLTDFRYREQAADQVHDGVAIWLARDGLLSELGERLERGPAPRRVGFEADHLTVRDRRALGERCGGVVWEDTSGLVEALRACKEPEEVEAIRRAVAIAERALAGLVERVEEGVRERDLAAELEYALRRSGSGPPPFLPIVASGARSSLPHAEPGDRSLREGDLLLVDFGASSGGYACDMTRTFVLGRAHPWQRSMHEAVRRAQEAALAAVRPGREARAVDAAARAVLEEEGLGEAFGHGTGHGLGLEVHEAPRLGRTSEDVLEVGHVVTLEPGVYLPGRGGVRVEDDVVVGEEGATVLTSYSRALAEL